MFCAYLVYSCAQPAGPETVLKAGVENIRIYVDGEAVAEHVRAYEHEKEILELAIICRSWKGNRAAYYRQDSYSMC